MSVPEKRLKESSERMSKMKKKERKLKDYLNNETDNSYYELSEEESQSKNFDDGFNGGI
jgi:hypothetical protein